MLKEQLRKEIYENGRAMKIKKPLKQKAFKFKDLQVLVKCNRDQYDTEKSYPKER